MHDDIIHIFSQGHQGQSATGKLCEILDIIQPENVGFAKITTKLQVKVVKVL